MAVANFCEMWGIDSAGHAKLRGSERDAPFLSPLGALPLHINFSKGNLELYNCSAYFSSLNAASIICLPVFYCVFCCSRRCLGDLRLARVCTWYTKENSLSEQEAALESQLELISISRLHHIPDMATVLGFSGHNRVRLF